MKLEYPKNSPTITITLPNAQLGNTEAIETNAIVRVTPSDESIAYTDPSWPVVTTQSFTIAGMDRAQRDNFLLFVNMSAADEIRLTDHDDVEWVGVIATSTLDIITTRDDCSYEVAIELVGERV